MARKIPFRDCEIFSLENESGSGKISVYTVFQGIELVYNDMHMGYCNCLQRKVSRVIEINHCRQGRYECVFGSQTYCYAGLGDMSISTFVSEKRDSCFPLGHYQGITITVDLDRMTDEIKTIMGLFSIDLKHIESLVKDREYFIVRANEMVGHIFSERYTVWDSIKHGYIRVKTLELLLALTDMEIEADNPDRLCFSRAQTDVVKHIHDFILEHISEHYTLNELAERFDISLTSMKTCFRGVYGTSVYAYLRTYRLQLAEKLLKDGRLYVAEIAYHIGYENPNKFTSAFKKAYGVQPTEFRKRYGTRNIKTECPNG